MTNIDKPRIETEEMYELFAQANPAFIPNRTNVGLFANKIGYKRAKQCINGKQVYFYVRADITGIQK